VVQGYVLKHEWILCIKAKTVSIVRFIVLLSMKTLLQYDSYQVLFDRVFYS
jgi:hypothetical protein